MLSLNSNHKAILHTLNETWNLQFSDVAIYKNSSPLFKPLYPLSSLRGEHVNDTNVCIINYNTNTNNSFDLMVTVIAILLYLTISTIYNSFVATKSSKKSIVTMKPTKPDYNVLIPWRLCVAGGWLDQPWVSKILQPLTNNHDIGSVIVMNVDYHNVFKERSGLATSSRKTAIKLWETGILPQNLDNIEIAKLLFGAENPPGTEHISGSQDHLGLLLPGINKLDYNGQYWPKNIVSMEQEAKKQGKDINDIYDFIDSVLWLVPFAARPNNFNPTAIQNLTVDNVRKLAMASEKVWNAILNKDAVNFGMGLTDTIKAYKLILPNTVPTEFEPIWQKYDRENYGCSFTGAGGGGFLLVISDHKPDKNAFQTKINTKSWWN